MTDEEEYADWEQKKEWLAFLREKIQSVHQVLFQLTIISIMGVTAISVLYGGTENIWIAIVMFVVVLGGLVYYYWHMADRIRIAPIISEYEKLIIDILMTRGMTLKQIRDGYRTIKEGGKNKNEGENVRQS